LNRVPNVLDMNFVSQSSQNGSIIYQNSFYNIKFALNNLRQNSS
jgi:hypothetical protein